MNKITRRFIGFYNIFIRFNDRRLKGVKSFRDGMDGRSSQGEEKGQAADPNASKDSAADNKEANGSADKEANA